MYHTTATLPSGNYEDADGIGVLFFVGLIALAIFGGEGAFVGQAWLLASTFTLSLTFLAGTMVDKKTSFSQELLFWFQRPGGAPFFEFVYIPLLGMFFIPFTLITRNSWRVGYERDSVNYLMQTHRGIHGNTCYEMTAIEALRISRRADELDNFAAEAAEKSSAFAQATAFMFTMFAGAKAWATEPIKLFLNTEFRSSYVTSNGVKISDKPMIIGNFGMSHRGLSLDIWGTESTTGDPATAEIDYTATYSREMLGISGQAGISYFDIRPVGKRGEGDIVKIWVSGRKTFSLDDSHTVTPFFELGRMQVTKDSGRNSAFFPQGGFIHSWQIADWLAWQTGFHAVYDTGIFDGPSGWTSHTRTGPIVTLGEHVTLSGSVRLVCPLGQIQGHDCHTVWNTSLSLH